MAFCRIYNTAFGDNCKLDVMINLETVKSKLEAM